MKALAATPVLVWVVMLGAAASDARAQGWSHAASIGRAQGDTLSLAAAIELHAAHVGAPPSLDALLRSVANARGEVAGPFINAIPSPPPGWTPYAYRLERDGSAVVSTTGPPGTVVNGKFQPSAGFRRQQMAEAVALWAGGALIAGIALGAIGWPAVRLRRRPVPPREGDAVIGRGAVIQAVLGGVLLVGCSVAFPMSRIWAGWCLVAAVSAPALFASALAHAVYFAARKVRRTPPKGAGSKGSG